MNVCSWSCRKCLLYLVRCFVTRHQLIPMENQRGKTMHLSKRLPGPGSETQIVAYGAIPVVFAKPVSVGLAIPVAL